jgi:hypothetical protein
MHLFGALFKAKNKGVFLLFLFFSEVMNGEWLSWYIEAFELLNIKADIMMS